MKANSQLSSPDMIMPGMKVRIPGETKHVKMKEQNQHINEEKSVRQLVNEEAQPNYRPMEDKIIYDFKSSYNPDHAMPIYPLRKNSEKVNETNKKIRTDDLNQTNQIKQKEKERHKPYQSFSTPNSPTDSPKRNVQQ